MKHQLIFLKNLGLSFRSLSIFLSISFQLISSSIEAQSSSKEEYPLSSKPLHEVATLGAPTTGALVEGMIGSVNKSNRHRFYCYSADPQEGFLGPQTIAKPLSLKDQPGIFPAPSMGPASLTFSFNCHHSKALLTPIVVRPDGTVFQGLPMTLSDSPQTLVISSPAQTGIYSLFILAHHKDSEGAQVIVNASISTQPEQSQTLQLKAFNSRGDDSALISAEFTYAPLR